MVYEYSVHAGAHKNHTLLICLIVSCNTLRVYSLVQAQYYHDPYDEEEYMLMCNFLPDINQELVSHACLFLSSFNSLSPSLSPTSLPLSLPLSLPPLSLSFDHFFLCRYLIHCTRKDYLI